MRILFPALALLLIVGSAKAIDNESFIFNPNAKYTGNLYNLTDSELLGIMFSNKNNKKDIIYWKSSYSEEENQFVPKLDYREPDKKIETKIIAKEKTGDDLLVLFSSNYYKYNCHSCTGVLSAILFSKNGAEWGIKNIENFEAGGSWGDNASLESVRNTKNKNPLFLFKYVYGNHGTFHDYVEIIAFTDGKTHNVFSSKTLDETLLSGSNNDCCLSVHEEIMMEFQDISFELAFNTVNEKYGKGYQFMWNDSVYKTYTEEDDPKGLSGFCGEKTDYSSACYTVNSEYQFIENSSKIFDDLVFTITGTREAYDIYDDYDKRGEAYPVKETHHFSFNEISLFYELDKENFFKSYFDGNSWIQY